MRKTIKFLGLAAVAASILASCQKEELVDNSSSAGMVEYSVVADYDTETKTAMADNGHSYVWSGGETLHVAEFYTIGGKTSVEEADSNEGEPYDGNKMKFSVSFRIKNAESYTYYSVYPAKAFKSTSINNDNNVITLNVELPEMQTPSVDSFDPSADILVSKPFKGKPNENGFEFELKRQSVGVKMKVRNFAPKNHEGVNIIYNAADETSELKRERIEKITITSENSNISGKTSYAFENGKVPGLTQTKYGTSNKVILDYSSIVDEDANVGLTIDNTVGNDIYFTTWPFVANSENPLYVEVQTTNYVFTKKLDFKGRELPFNKANINIFNVGFNAEDVTIEHKPVPNPVLKATYYVVARDDKAMVAKKDQSYIAARTITADEVAEDQQNSQIQLSYNAETGKYDINDVEPLPAVWKFEYSPISGKYLISSVSDPDKYLKDLGNQTMDLASRANATYFSVEENGNGGYTITASGRYLGCVSKFSMLFAENDNTKLTLTEANIASTFKVQDKFEIPVAGGEFVIPVSLLNIEKATVAAESDAEWLSNVKFVDGGVQFTAAAGKDDETNEATITLTGKVSEESSDIITKTVTVYQHHSVYYATLNYSELADALKAGKWGTYDKYYEYLSPNGAVWGIGAQATYDGKMNMTAGQGYVKLPEFGEGRSIRRVTVKLSTAPFADRYIGLYPSSESNEAIATVYITAADKAAGRTTYVISVDQDNVRTAYIKTNTNLAITDLEVDARKPLDTPAGLAVAAGTKTLSWNAVENAVAYDVTVGTKTVENVKGTSYTFDGADEWYDATVVAKADANSIIYIDSNPSETANLKFGNPKLNTPDLKEAGAKQHTLKVTWTVDERATGYVCSIAPAGTAKEQGNGVVEFEGLTADTEYTVTVYATSEGRYDASEKSAIKVKTADIELEGDGSVDTPYTVKDVNELKENNSLALAGKYVRGTVKARSLNGGKMSYTIADASGKEWSVAGNDLGNAAFSSVDELPVNAEVVIYYLNDTDNYLYSIGGKTSILTGIEVGAETKSNYEYNEAFAEPVVYASYRGADKKEVSGTVASKPANVTASATLTVNYTEGGVSKSATYDVKVVKFTHVAYAANLPYAITTVTNGGVTSAWTNFVRYDSLKSLRGKAAVCSVNISAIPEEINTITFGIESVGINGTPCTLVVKDSTGKETSIDFTFMKPTTTINLGAQYKNCTYSIELDCTTFGSSKRLDISQIVFENK